MYKPKSHFNKDFWLLLRLSIWVWNLKQSWNRRTVMVEWYSAPTLFMVLRANIMPAVYGNNYGPTKKEFSIYGVMVDQAYQQDCTGHRSGKKLLVFNPRKRKMLKHVFLYLFSSTTLLVAIQPAAPTREKTIYRTSHLKPLPSRMA